MTPLDTALCLALNPAQFLTIGTQAMAVSGLLHGSRLIRYLDTKGTSMSFDYRYPTPTFPGMDAVSVTPSDSTEYDPPFRALYVGGVGNVVITTLRGNVATFVDVLPGSILPVSGVKVRAATTATNITAIF